MSEPYARRSWAKTTTKKARNGERERVKWIHGDNQKAKNLDVMVSYPSHFLTAVPARRTRNFTKSDRKT